MHKKKGVALTANNGANLNSVSEEALEALVKYKFRSLSCSLDGASQEIYSIYRKGGEFNNVIENILTINKYKKQHNSPYPVLQWQYIAFGHNEHEIPMAREMAHALNMEFNLKLSWEDFYTDDFYPVRNTGLIRSESKDGVASRQEYKEKHGQDYALRNCCIKMWLEPQINYDGKLLGCPVNHWGKHGEIFETGLKKGLNTHKAVYTRNMLMGLSPELEDIACSHCSYFKMLKKNNDWLTVDEIRSHSFFIPGRLTVKLENIFSKRRNTKRLLEKYINIRTRVHKKSLGFIIRKISGRIKSIPSRITAMMTARPVILHNNIYSLEIPLPLTENNWKQFPLFKGSTRSLSGISGHASSLKKGVKPHPPHTHHDEELLFLLSGETEIILK